MHIHVHNRFCNHYPSRSSLARRAISSRPSTVCAVPKVYLSDLTTRNFFHGNSIWILFVSYPFKGGQPPISSYSCSDIAKTKLFDTSTSFFVSWTMYVTSSFEMRSPDKVSKSLEVNSFCRHCASDIESASTTRWNKFFFLLANTTSSENMWEFFCHIWIWGIKTPPSRSSRKQDEGRYLPLVYFLALANLYLIITPRGPISNLYLMGGMSARLLAVKFRNADQNLERAHTRLPLNTVLARAIINYINSGTYTLPLAVFAPRTSPWVTPHNWYLDVLLWGPASKPRRESRGSHLRYLVPRTEGSYVPRRQRPSFFQLPTCSQLGL